MNIRLFRNLSANTLQLVVNQLFGAVIFYVLSVGFDKAAFGQINLALAVLLSAFNILSFGIDQLTVKKVAQGDDVQQVTRLYISHVIITGLLFYGLLLLGYAIFHTSPNYDLILWIGAGKLMIFFSMPFKQVSNGLEKFSLLAKMSVISNVLRALALLGLMFCQLLTFNNIVITFIAGDTLEFVFTVALFYKNTGYPVKLKFEKPAYLSLIREAMPQLGVVVITSVLSRFDWLFIGFMVSDVKLAEYSFAYKVFEISTFPLLAIAPLLIPQFTRHFKNDGVDSGHLKFLLRAEFIIATFTALLLNMTWEPVVNWLTHAKYGTVNITTVFVLSLCIPLLYINNFLWTIQFARGQLTLILQAFIITLIVNVGANLVLIPAFGNVGAAAAFLLSCLSQTLFLLSKNTVSQLNGVFYIMLICTFCAIAGGFTARMLPVNEAEKIIASIVIYLCLLFVTMQLKIADRNQLKRLFYT
jgi:O-antigen/teichoic acid export membrane protein